MSGGCVRYHSGCDGLGAGDVVCWWIVYGVPCPYMLLDVIRRLLWGVGG